MMATGSANARIPVICAHPASVVCAGIFDPNSWPTDSRGLVHSCWSELSVLHHCVDQIADMCKEPEQLCRNQIDDLQQQWASAKFDLSKVVLLGEQPDLHIRIEAFFSGVKSLLDLIVQLLSTEKIVSATIHGFHRDQNVYGGSVLNALRNNARRDRKELAEKIVALLNEHKEIWIDQVIEARDLLTHPKVGMHQLMFNFECDEKDGALVCQINPPAVHSISIDQYAQTILEQAKSFSSVFVALLQQAVSNNGVQSTPESERG